MNTLATGAKSTLAYHYTRAGRGTITGPLGTGETLQGEYSVVDNAAIGWGSVYSATGGKRYGAAVLTGDRGTVLNCEFICRLGRELFYRRGDKMMVVDITSQPNFTVGKPHMLFEGKYLPTPGTSPNYDVSPDGQRFLMLKPTEQAGAAPTQINVVLNWFEELKQKVPTGKK